MYIFSEVVIKQSNKESKLANQTCVISVLPRSPEINLLDLSSLFFKKQMFFHNFRVLRIITNFTWNFPITTLLS